jgi:hypothetical protein
MKRIVTGALVAALAGLWFPDMAVAGTAKAAPALRIARTQPPITEFSAQNRRPLRRVPIYRQDDWAPDVYPRYNPGPNAVRDCSAHYVQEYRPSGTVITPRMNCVWRPG